MCTLVIKKVENLSDLQTVYRITYNAYVTAGLCAYREDKKIVHHPQLDVIPQSSIFIIQADHKAIGTVTVTEDNPHGMPMEEEFKEILQNLRKKKPVSAYSLLAPNMSLSTNGYLMLRF